MRGKKGDRHPDPDDPPRCRANKRRGRGTYSNDRPPVLGLVGRESRQLRLEVCLDTKQATIQPEVEAATDTQATLYSDECSAYTGIDRLHRTVCHSKREYARDDDGDGFCEVHCNTMEGIWTGLRNYLRPFRGVHKKYLAQYVILFEWAHNLKRVNGAFLRALMIPGYTYDPI